MRTTSNTTNAIETSDARDATATSDASDRRDTPAIAEENVLRVRLGHGANCSSVGSVVDTLFLGATLGGVVFAAICAAMKVEGVTVVGVKREREGESAREREGESESESESEGESESGTGEGAP
jgi:hypothetical protein